MYNIQVCLLSPQTLVIIMTKFSGFKGELYADLKPRGEAFEKLALYSPYYPPFSPGRDKALTPDLSSNVGKLFQRSQGFKDSEPHS